MPQPSTIHHWTLTGANDQPIYGTTHLPTNHTKPIGKLLLCHGFKGYKDYGFFPQLAEFATKHGLVAHRFNFSHSGVTDDPRTFAHPERFANNTWSKQIADLLAVHHAAKTGVLSKHAPNKPIAWFGHSRGGLTTIIAAAHNDTQQTDGPCAIVAAASPNSPYGFSPEQIDRLRDTGHIDAPSARTGQSLTVNRIWLDDIEQHRDTHNPLKAIRHSTCPLLIIHGDTDETVPIDAAHQLHRASQGRATLEVINDAGHTFNAPNPLPLDADAPKQTLAMIQLTCGFAASHCSG